VWTINTRRISTRVTTASRKQQASLALYQQPATLPGFYCVDSATNRSSSSMASHHTYLLKTNDYPTGLCSVEAAELGTGCDCPRPLEVKGLHPMGVPQPQVGDYTCYLILGLASIVPSERLLQIKSKTSIMDRMRKRLLRVMLVFFLSTTKVDQKWP
jgi:hypothetical protein